MPGKVTSQRQKARERDKTGDAQEAREIPGRITKKIDSEIEKGEEHERLSTKMRRKRRDIKTEEKERNTEQREKKKCKIK